MNTNTSSTHATTAENLTTKKLRIWIDMSGSAVPFSGWMPIFTRVITQITERLAPNERLNVRVQGFQHELTEKSPSYTLSPGDCAEDVAYLANDVITARAGGTNIHSVWEKAAELGPVSEGDVVISDLIFNLRDRFDGDRSDTTPAGFRYIQTPRHNPDGPKDARAEVEWFSTEMMAVYGETPTVEAWSPENEVSTNNADTAAATGVTLSRETQEKQLTKLMWIITNNWRFEHTLFTEGRSEKDPGDLANAQARAVLEWIDHTAQQTADSETQSA